VLPSRADALPLTLLVCVFGVVGEEGAEEIADIPVFGASIRDELVVERTDDEDVDVATECLYPPNVPAILSLASPNVSPSNSTNTPSAPLHPYRAPSLAHLKSMRHGYASPGSLWQHIHDAQSKQPWGPQGRSRERQGVDVGLELEGWLKMSCDAAAKGWRGRRKGR